MKRYPWLIFIQQDLIKHLIPGNLGVEVSECTSINSGVMTGQLRRKLCTPNTELMTMGLRPFYLPRKFNQLFVTVVYIHPGADVRDASHIIKDRIHRLETISPDSLKFIVGDFCQCTLDNVLPS